jgi:hypothetical protein
MPFPFPTDEEIMAMSTEEILRRMKGMLAELDARTARSVERVADYWPNKSEPED